MAAGKSWLHFIAFLAMPRSTRSQDRNTRQPGSDRFLVSRPAEATVCRQPHRPQEPARLSELQSRLVGIPGMKDGRSTGTLMSEKCTPQCWTCRLGAEVPSRSQS
ncbi:hypothetical protein BKA67DRAFT_543744 [Truncatella angustata]|uniref:Secreted protein n=1 Tax=Truncatella angustata TaxID=152316 RepID=A0A9P9A2I7_9PEZI|nr:uncharacterized protein BKA67DRAFT_543744 [Truncatella angustata]KAH6659163.1 hypothetical protein BKA67DRAFT_543744 [Truncatella angustata]